MSRGSVRGGRRIESIRFQELVFEDLKRLMKRPQVQAGAHKSSDVAKCEEVSTAKPNDVIRTPPGACAEAEWNKPICFGRGNSGQRPPRVGRGTLLNSFEQKKPDPKNIQVTIPDPQSMFVKNITNIDPDCDNPPFIRMTIYYFAHCEDYQFYIDKMIYVVLKSSKLVDIFAKTAKLITLIKKHGEKIKAALFTKLQSDFMDIVTLMADIGTPSEQKRITLMHYCELVNKIYFHFRPRLDLPDRYDVLVVPTTVCWQYLLKTGGERELESLVKLITLNFDSLASHNFVRMKKFTLECRDALSKGRNKKELLWIMCAVDLMETPKSELPSYLLEYYHTRLGRCPWLEVIQSPKRILADIPSGFTETEMEMFTMTGDEYDKYKFVEM